MRTNKDWPSDVAGTQALQGVSSQPGKTGCKHCLISLSNSGISCSGSMQKAEINIAKCISSKVTRASTHQESLLLLCYGYFFPYSGFPYLEIPPAASNSCQQHCKLARIKKKEQKAPITTPTVFTGLNVNFVIVSNKFGSMYRCQISRGKSGNFSDDQI